MPVPHLPRSYYQPSSPPWADGLRLDPWYQPSDGFVPGPLGTSPPLPPDWFARPGVNPQQIAFSPPDAMQSLESLLASLSPQQQASLLQANFGAAPQDLFAPPTIAAPPSPEPAPPPTVQAPAPSKVID